MDGGDKLYSLPLPSQLRSKFHIGEPTEHISYHFSLLLQHEPVSGTFVSDDLSPRQNLAHDLDE